MERWGGLLEGLEADPAGAGAAEALAALQGEVRGERRRFSNVALLCSLTASASACRGAADRKVPTHAHPSPCRAPKPPARSPPARLAPLPSPAPPPRSPPSSTASRRTWWARRSTCSAAGASSCAWTCRRRCCAACGRPPHPPCGPSSCPLWWPTCRCTPRRALAALGAPLGGGGGGGLGISGCCLPAAVYAAGAPLLPAVGTAGQCMQPGDGTFSFAGQDKIIHGPMRLAVHSPSVQRVKFLRCWALWGVPGGLAAGRALLRGWAIVRCMVGKPPITRLLSIYHRLHFCRPGPACRAGPAHWAVRGPGRGCTAVGAPGPGGAGDHPPGRPWLAQVLLKGPNPGCTAWWQLPRRRQISPCKGRSTSEPEHHLSETADIFGVGHRLQWPGASNCAQART